MMIRGIGCIQVRQKLGRVVFFTCSIRSLHRYLYVSFSATSWPDLSAICFIRAHLLPGVVLSTFWPVWTTRCETSPSRDSGVPTKRFERRVRRDDKAGSAGGRRAPDARSAGAGTGASTGGASWPPSASATSGMISSSSSFTVAICDKGSCQGPTRPSSSSRASCRDSRSNGQPTTAGATRSTLDITLRVSVGTAGPRRV